MKPSILIFLLSLFLIGCASKPCKRCKGGGGGGLARGEGRGALDDDDEERSDLQRALDDARDERDRLQNQILNGGFNPALAAGPQLGGFGGLQQLPLPQGGPFGADPNGQGNVGEGQVFTPPASGTGPLPAQPGAPVPSGQINAIVNRRELSPSRGFRAAFETTHGDEPSGAFGSPGVGEVPTPRRTLDE